MRKNKEHNMDERERWYFFIVPRPQSNNGAAYHLTREEDSITCDSQGAHFQQASSVTKIVHFRCHEWP
jgi:hypothetical protein